MKIQLLSICIIAISIACNKNTSVCYTCSGDIIEREYTNGKITIYNVITPNNHSNCDSFVYVPSMGTYVEPYWKYTEMKRTCTAEEKRTNPQLCPCVENKYSIYNDNKNAAFIIEGIENYPYNRLTIQVEGQRTNLKVYENYDNTNVVFRAYLQDTMRTDRYIMKHLSGNFSYTLELFGNEHKNSIIDVIAGKLTVIRKPQDCTAANCKGKDSDDPLLDKQN